jgi:hypothetical protein
MLFFFCSTILLRVAFPVPIRSGADDFGYLLLADTLAHFRLANPPHALPQFFESVFILQQPSYASIYPLGQGLVLAAGQFLGNPWVGVVLSGAVFCALCYWMLRAWVAPVWAFAGGMLAVIQFGPLNPWMNSYWGGYVSAIAGCLVFGSLPRRNGWLLGLGLALQMISRPFEAVFLFTAVAIYLAFTLRSWKPLISAVGLVLLAAGFIAFQNQAVTKSWTTMPYVLSRYQYGVPATFTFQPSPIPHRQLTAEQELDYRAQSSIHDSSGGYFQRLLYRFRYLRFFLLPPLYIAALAFIPSLRQRRYLWVLGAVVLFALGSNFYPYFYPHYIAAVTCLLLLVSVEGLARLNLTSRSLLLVLSAASFVFWLAFYPRLSEYQSWNYISLGDPQGRGEIASRLLHSPGQQLVFVHYGPYHRFEEWVHNDADIDHAQTVWANDLGADENQKLLSYYPNRKAWLLEPDVHPPALTPYLSVH